MRKKSERVTQRQRGQDLDKCHMALLPWPNVFRTLKEAWVAADADACVWRGVLSPVRRGGGGVHVPVVFKWRGFKAELDGPWALKWEILWFVWARCAAPSDWTSCDSRRHR
jgi:hypothetical protein